MNNLFCFYCEQFRARLRNAEAEKRRRVRAEAIFPRRKAIKCVEHNKLQKETNNQPEANEYE